MVLSESCVKRESPDIMVDRRGEAMYPIGITFDARVIVVDAIDRCDDVYY